MDTRPFLIALILSFFLMILTAVAAGLIRSRHKDTTGDVGPKWKLLIKVFYLLLFGVAAFSLVPAVVHFFLSAQIRIGNGDLLVIKWITAHEKQVVFGIWGLFGAGLAMALPAAKKDGFFK